MSTKGRESAETVKPPKILSFFEKVPGSIVLPPGKHVVERWSQPPEKTVQKTILFDKLVQVPKKTDSPKEKRPRKKIIVPKQPGAEKYKAYQSAESLAAIDISVETEPNVIETGYHAYSNREAPPNYDAKPTPCANTLESFVFVITGVLDSMEKDEAKAYIEACGGSVTAGVAAKTTHALIGKSCGPSKIAKIKERKIPMLSESSLVKLVAHFSKTIPTASNPTVQDVQPIKKPESATAFSDDEFEVDSD